jgi:hypothetical protein
LLSLWRPSGVDAGDSGLRLAVRKGYLNFYFGGQSVARVGFTRQGEPFAETHVKYAFGSGQKVQDYARLKGTEIRHPDRATTREYKGIETLAEWIKEATSHQGAEKYFVDQVAADNASVIDLEMGLPGWAEHASALRMDIVALERQGHDLRIVFWEAKTMSDARLKSNAAPEIFQQIKNYKAYVAAGSHRSDIVAAYQSACVIIGELHAMAGGDSAVGALSPFISEAAASTSRLDVDPTPRLVIYDDIPIRSKAWAGHEAKIQAEEVRFLICKNRPHVLTSSGPAV